MAKFTYVAKDRAGRTTKGELEASDKTGALNSLRSKGMLVLKLEAAKRGFSLNMSFGPPKKAKIKMDELVVFARQMATMTGAGITIVSSLDTLAEQTDNVGFKNMLKDVRNSVNTGTSLSEAMSKYERVFTSYFVNMVKAGESSGMLEDVLERVSEYVEKTNDLQKKIKSAMTYPAVVTGMAVLITLVMIIKVIPVFQDMFSGFGIDLPGPTQFLINLSDAVRSYSWLIIIIIMLIIFTAKWYARTEKGRYNVDSIKLKVPVFGLLLRKVAISKFTRTLGTLVKSGVPILSALDIVSKTAGNVVIEKAISDVQDNIREGESISAPMERSGIFPPMVTRMVAVGEKSGELEKMLTKISDFIDNEVDASVDGLTSLIEPLVIAFLGIVIGGIVICMFLPIFKLSSVVQM